MNTSKKISVLFFKQTNKERNLNFQVKLIFCFLLIVCLFSCEKETNLPDNNVLPEKYDLREHGWVTPVRNQNGLKPDGTSDMGTTVGLCWAFASLASIESNMLVQNLSSSPFASGASLSPWYLGNYIDFNYPCYEFNNETIPVVKPPLTFGYYFPDCGWGGSGASWTGNYLIAGNELPTWDDCPMPSSDQNAHITLEPPVTQNLKKYNIAHMSIIIADDFPTTNDYIKDIKNYIYEHGAIQGAVHLEAIDIQGITSQIVNGVEYEGSRFMDKQNFNMYTYEVENLGTQLLTHCVAITGWDDNRMINVGGHTATGAWIVKDSQSEKNWDNGYFNVAYDDLVVNIFSSGLIACKEMDYEHQSKYQTHPGILSRFTESNPYNDENSLELGEYGYLFNGYNSGNSWGVAEFPLNSDETLAAVGIFSSNRNQTVSVHIYKDNLNSEPLIAQDFTLDELGYHMLKLNNIIEFLCNEKMIIAVGFKNESSHTRLPLCYVQDDNYNFDYPTFFGTREDDVFQLQSYSDFNPNSAFFLQAIVKK